MVGFNWGPTQPGRVTGPYRELDVTRLLQAPQRKALWPTQLEGYGPMHRGGYSPPPPPTSSGLYFYYIGFF